MNFKLSSVYVILFLFYSCGSNNNNNVPAIESTESKTVVEDSFYCYSKGLTSINSIHSFKFDKVEFLTGEDAGKAMIEDGRISNSETLPNNFYIRNSDTLIESMPVDDSVTILMQTLSNDENGNFNWNEKIGLNNFIKLFDKTALRNFTGYPFFIKTKNNKIVFIKEQYIP